MKLSLHELLISIVNQVIYVPIRHHYKCRAIITYVVSALQITLFMQNKPNFQKSQMNVNMVLTVDYERKDTWWSGKNKPNSNPIQTQSNPIKANKMPKQTQFKPKQTQFQRQKKCCRCCTSFGRLEITNSWRSLRPWVLMFLARWILVCRVSVILYLLCRRLRKDIVRYFPSRAGSRGALLLGHNWGIPRYWCGQRGCGVLLHH